MSEMINVPRVPARIVYLLSRFEAASGKKKNPPSVPSIAGQLATHGCWDGEDIGDDK